MSDPRLSDSARRLLEHIASKLASGWSGTWELEINQGGVRDFKETTRPLALDTKSRNRIA